jgi:RHS repeat-associated protein
VDYVLTEAAGASTSPSVTARVLDGGATQAGYSTYNANGMITQSVDPLGRTTNYSYNSNGVDLYQVTQANGSSQDVLKTLTNYNSQHEPQTIVDAAGQAMTLTYNSAGQVTSSTVNVSGSNQTTTLSYTGPGGSGAGNYLTTVTGPISGATTSYTYDSDERVQAVTDSEGYTLTYGYDNLDRQTSVTYPDSTTDLTYYRNLDVDHTVDRQKRTIWNQYDAIHELLQTTDPLGRTTKYTWCLCGGLSTLTDPNGNVTTWGLDTQGRVTSKTYADSTSISYVYETNESRLHAMTDARENVVTDSYNTDDTLSGISYTPGSGVAPTPNVHFGYDPVYNRVTSMTDGTGTTTRTYNPVNGVVGAGQLASVSMPIAGSLATSTFTYDKLGRIVTRDVDHAKTNANNSSTTYDVLGRVTNVSNALGAFTYTYVDETSRLSGVTYPSGTGLSTSYSYFGNTGNQRLQEIKNMQGTTQLSKFNYTYNPVGTIATWTTQADSNTAIVNTLTYDAADQLITGVQSGGGSASNAYSYDPAGNRLTETTTTGTTTGNCNKLNQLMSLTSSSTIQTISGYTSAAVTNVTVNAVPASIGNSTNFSASVPLTPGSTNMISVVAQPSSSSGTTTTQRWNVVTSGTAPATQLVYDANGNVTTDENGNNYQWDALNRLTAIIYHSGANAGNHTEFAYNGLGQRTQIVEKTGVTVGSGTVISTENYLWIGSEITEVRNASNAVTKRFFPQGEQQSSTNYYYTRDHLRSVREMCGSSGTIVARYSYDPFGNTILLSGTNLATRQFAGMFLHNVSQDYQTWGRIYDQNAGRWLSRDPLGEQKGVNLYNYVQNAPIDAIDPVGLCGMFVVRPATVDTGTQTDPLKGNVVGGRGYQVEYQNTGCCAGSIKLVQSINSYWTPLQIDGKPLPAADGLPDMTTQSKQAVPGKSFVDSPGNQDLDTYTLEVCAVCRHQDGYECEVGCVTFQWYASTGKILSGGGASEAQLPGDQYTKAKKKYRPAP